MNKQMTTIAWLWVSLNAMSHNVSFATLIMFPSEGSNVFRKNKVKVSGLYASLEKSDEKISRVIDELQELVSKKVINVIQGKKLAEIAELNYETYGKDLLIAGTSLDDKTAYEIVNIDSKPFEFGSQKALVAQVNTVDISAVLARKDELEKVMRELMEKEGYDFVSLMITDIIVNSTELYVVGDKTLTIKTFGMQEGAETVFLPNVVSRKKQIVPQYTDMAK